MKAVCVTHDYLGEYSSFSVKKMLTIGKYYDVEEKESASGNKYYYLICDEGYKCYLSKSYFKLIDELRENKLNKILV
jgi:hypothetical protein